LFIRIGFLRIHFYEVTVLISKIEKMISDRNNPQKNKITVVLTIWSDYVLFQVLIKLLSLTSTVNGAVEQLSRFIF